MKKWSAILVSLTVIAMVITNITKSNPLIPKNLVEQTDKATENDTKEYDVSDSCIHKNQFTFIVPILKWLLPLKQDLAPSEFFTKLRKPPKV